MADRSISAPIDLEEKLEKFFGLFQPTIQLAKNLVDAHSNAQEVILLGLWPIGCIGILYNQR